MVDELFEINEEGTGFGQVAQDVQIDEKKLRLKRLRDGDERLTPDDFVVDGEFNQKDHVKYVKLIEDHEKNARRAFDDDEFVAEQVRALLKTLHKSTSPFAKYLPTSRKGRAPRKPTISDIPELNRLNELCKAVEVEFSKWLSKNKDYRAVEDYLKELGLDENSTYTKGKGDKAQKVKVLDEYQGFQPYWRYIGAVKTWIRENFGSEGSKKE